MDCDIGWTYDTLSEKCYQIFEESLSWHSANVSCRQKGGDLASITSSDQQQFLAGKTLIYVHV